MEQKDFYPDNYIKNRRYRDKYGNWIKGGHGLDDVLQEAMTIGDAEVVPNIFLKADGTIKRKSRKHGF